MSRQELQLGLVPLPGRPDESMSNVWADPRRQRAADGGGRSTSSRGRWSVLKICQCALRPGTQLDCSPIPVGGGRLPSTVPYGIAILAYPPDTV